jgi:ATP-dependent Lon protease
VPKSIRIEHNNEKMKIPGTLPLVPLRDMVIFPNMVSPLLLGRQFSLDALQEAMVREKLIFLSTQHKPHIEEPQREDLYTTGTVTRILQVMKLPNQMIKVLAEGITRARIMDMYLDENCYSVELEFPQIPDGADDNHMEALARQVSRNFEEYVRYSHKVPDEVLMYLSHIEDRLQLADIISANLEVKVKIRQELLESPTIYEQFTKLDEILKSEIEILKIQESIDNTVKDSLISSQREYYLQHQLKAIKEELGQFEESQGDAGGYHKKLKKLKAPKEVKKKAREEIERLQKMHPFSAEAAVVRGYLDWVLELPWETHTKDRDDFKKVSKILDEDHYGLDKPKKRILEHLAVIRLAEKTRGPILCLVGPPGVGKTSLGKSVARALNRKFVRMSLGGMKDEAEIRGHRRTYIGALPGRIIQSIKKAGSSNPVFMLDEIDKIGADYRGDPAAALLEALDPEQNNSFSDHFLELDYDLSQVLFLTTANTLQGIPTPLIDRMEVIRLPGYLDYEKLKIAQNHLVTRLKKEMGLSGVKITMDKNIVMKVIHDYTRESGVRELERMIATVYRKVAQEKVTHPRRRSFKVTAPKLKEYLGAPRFQGMERLTRPIVGRAYGLAWTETGGELLPVEVSLMSGKSKLNLTGKLGDVMKESASAALSYIRSKASDFGLERDFFKNLEIHVHIPEGAVPKDGPSAGITLMVALLSALTDKPVPSDIALTGELTLTGQVLPIGGLNEKFIAAKRARIKKIVCPKRNSAEIEELNNEVKSGLDLRMVKTADQVIAEVFNGGKKRHARTKKR